MARLAFSVSICSLLLLAFHQAPVAAQDTPQAGQPKDADRGPLAALKSAAGNVRYTKLVVAGEPVEKGMYDPSVAYTPDGGVGWLAYSRVRGDGNVIKGKLALGEYVSTHLARTTDGGATWKFAKVVNRSIDGTCVMPDGKELQGVWRYEVPSLVCDPTDPDAHRRWKLFAHYYFWERNRDSRQKYSWIVLRTAADPAGEWSAEVPLFGAGKNPPAPYDKTRVNVNALDGSLKDTAVYTEPGALVHDGRLYLSLTALHPHLGLDGFGVRYTIVLLASDDHGVSWKFIGPLLTPDDAGHFGYEYFDGTSLALDGGRPFLLAVPGSRHGQMHDGCVAFEFESLPTGKLRRDSAGLPVVANYFAPQPGILSGPGAGQSTYDAANVHGGLIFPQFNLAAYPEIFQVFQTGQRLVPAEGAADAPLMTSRPSADTPTVKPLDRPAVAWSPDGSRYLVNKEDKNDIFQLYIGRRGDKDPACVTDVQLPGGPRPDRHKYMASWHPSGKWIILGVERAEHENLWWPKGIRKGIVECGIWLDMYAATPDGKHWYKLVDTAGGFTGVPFTKDGKLGAWAKIVDGNIIAHPKFGVWKLEIGEFVVERGVPSFKNVKDISPPGAVWLEPGNFSPDGQSLLITSDIGMKNNEGMDQYILNVKTQKLTNLTNSPDVWDEHGVFSPDGKQVLFMSSYPYRNDPKASHTFGLKTEFMLINVDGSGLRQLTHFNVPGYPESFPHGKGAVAACGMWTPDGSKIIAYSLRFPDYDWWEITFPLHPRP